MTIYDIASEAGVSISTVSRVLNRFDYVRPETRKRVLDVIQRNSYVPNALARGLVSNSMKVIGVMTSDIRNYRFAETAANLENLFFDRGYSTILCNTGNKPEKRKDYIQILAERKVDGIVLIGSVFTGIEIEESIEKFLPDVPMVLINSSLALPNAHTVLVDHNHGLDLAVCHLNDRGHRGILFVNTSNTYNAERKITGFHRAMERYGLSPEGAAVRNASYGLEGAEMIDQIIKSSPKTTALIFGDDNTAFCSVRRLRQMGRRVPQDMAVIGYTNSFYSLYSDPQLTSIDTKNEMYSTMVANMMHDLLENIPVESSLQLTPDLVVRDST